MAMDIISKERKEIRWKGLPSNVEHNTEMLLVRNSILLRVLTSPFTPSSIAQAERNERMKRIEQKKQHLQDLLVQVRKTRELISLDPNSY